MENLKNKNKDDLFKDLQTVASRMVNIKETIEGMLLQLEELQKEYDEISDQIRK